MIAVRLYGRQKRTKRNIVQKVSLMSDDQHYTQYIIAVWPANESVDSISLGSRFSGDEHIAIECARDFYAERDRSAQGARDQEELDGNPLSVAMFAVDDWDLEQFQRSVELLGLHCQIIVSTSSDEE